MKVIIDFGTSRTAFAGIDDASIWQRLSSPQQPKPNFPETPGWSRLKTLIDGVGLVRIEERGEMSYIVTYSRYCDIGGLIVPVSKEGTFVLFPAGAEPVPPPPASGGDFTFESIKGKERPDWAKSFLGALKEMIHAWSPAQAQWVIGRSCGGIDPIALEGLPPGTTAFNEAVAVIFALVSLEGLLSNTDDKFVVLADLGGGFLDISVAHNILLGEEEGNAQIVNYGGYPLGVDRLGQRFSRDPIENPDPMRRLVVEAIVYHIWDYRQRHHDKTSGVVFLTGGGFKRLSNSSRQISKEITALVQQAAGATVKVVMPREYDTKHLTIAGLARMVKLGVDPSTGDLGEDISERDPGFHGKPIWATKNIQLPPGAQSWAGFLEGRLRSAYRRN